MVRYKELTAVDWTLAGVPTTNILLENLISCKNYRVQVKSVCPIAESSYTDALLFKTHCAPSSTGDPAVLTAEMHVLPNPFYDQVNVWVATYETKRMTVQVYDMLGRVVWHKNYGRMQEGRHLMELQLDALPVGVYWIRIDTDDFFMAEKLIKQ